MAQRRVRVLLAMSGQDGHDRGARVVALALRNAGMEVIYAGLSRVVDQVAAAALQEDVDVVALCVPRSARPSLARTLLGKLEASGIRKGLGVAVVGAIAPPDAARMREMGVDGIFPAATAPGEIVAWVRGLKKKRGERGTA